MSSFQPTMGLPPLSAIAAVDHASTAVPSSNGGSTAPIGPSSATEYRDARIKDPIPKKLKGHTGNLSGNFGIMQMDLGGHESPLERDELAKRASESTELAAMRAYQSGHGVSSTKRFVRVPDDFSSWDAYYATSTTAQASGQPPSPVTASQPLTPADIKNEQTRLLALLRGLSPSSVVDQICKALSYFGGSPGAAPPPDGVFPRSELSNGSGGAFVGWIAEIFPRLANETLSTAKSLQQSQPAGLSTPAPDNSAKIGARREAVLPSGSGSKSDANPAPSTEASGNVRPEAATEAPAVSTEKRRRGRPKGSKATKVRRDKGIKKGPVKERKALAAAAAASATSKAPSTTQDLRLNLQSSLGTNEGHGEDSWVDVDDDNMLDVSAAVGDGLFFSAETNANLSADSQLGSELSMRQAPASGGNGTATVDSFAAPNAHTGESGKKRGRPKGSKNRPKAPVTEPSDEAQSGSGPVTVTPIPPPVVPNAAALSKKPKAKKQNASSTKTGAKGTTVSAQVEQHTGASHGNGQATESPQLQKSYELQSTAVDVRHGALLPPNGTPAAAGSKRKRPRVSKQDNTATEPAQVHNSAGISTNVLTTGNGSHTMQQIDHSHGVLGPSKKQRKLGDTNTSVHSSVNGSASPAPDILSNNATGGFGQADGSLGADTSIMQTLDSSNGANGEFNAAAAFEALSTHLEQDPPVGLAEQHQQSHDNGLSSLSSQQLSTQGRQSLQHQQQQQQQQQQPLTAQKTMSLTPPFHTTDRMQGQGRIGQQHASQNHAHQQGSQHHGGQNQQNQQMQQLHSHQHVSSHAASSTPLQHNPQTQMSASLSTGSLAAQQLPRPNRVPQTYYAQSRAASNSQFGQALPQPLQHSQQQQQQQQQKQHFNSQYQSQGTYPPQPQQHQAFTAQQRQTSQSAGSSSPGLLNHGNIHRSPQFAAPNATAIRSGHGAYGTNSSAGTMGFNPPTYDQNRRQSSAASPSLGHTYGTTGATAHTLSQQSPASFMGARPQHSPGAPHPQGVGGVTQGMQSFHGFDGPSLFDGINLDATGSGSGLGLSSPTAYGLGGSVPRSSGNVSGFGSSSSANSFDTNIGGAVRDRFYGVRR